MRHTGSGQFFTLLLVTISGMATFPGTTTADDVMLTASGTISTVSTGLEQGFKVGQRVSYQLIYDSTSSSSHARTSFGIYLDAIRTFGVAAGAFTAVSPAGEIRVADRIADVGDVFIAEASFADGLTGPGIGRLPLTRISIQLWDTEAAAWDSHQLPVSFLPVAEFDNRVFSLDFVDSNSTYIVTGLLDTLSITLVPAAETGP